MGSDTETLASCTLPLTACPRCGAHLKVDRDQVCCPTCVCQWEIRDGIPRFYNPGYYWGEVPQEEASSLLSEARTLGWRQAVQERFQHDPAVVYSILQWQSRASWLPLLGLNDNAIALDIGSGYGAITQALANAAQEVYSVEAIPERIEFTSIRLKQEGLSNVRLIQASATDLPLQGNVFDLVVVNGILEWVGEWDLSVPPQEVQLKFLRKIHHMLKPGGILLLGIENRIGYNNFRGIWTIPACPIPASCLAGWPPWCCGAAGEPITARSSMRSANIGPTRIPNSAIAASCTRAALGT